jgi:hypothetical protein
MLKDTRMTVGGELVAVEREFAKSAGIPDERLRPFEAPAWKPEHMRVMLQHAAWIESPLRDGWVAAFRLVGQGTRVVIAEARIFPDVWKGKRRPFGIWTGTLADDVGAAGVPKGGISQQLLREVRLTATPEMAKQFLAEIGALPGLQYLENGPPGVDRPTQRTRKSNAGRKPVSDEELTVAAKAYVEAVDKAKPIVPSVRRALAAMTKKAVTLSTVRNRIFQARDRGFLTRILPGRRVSGSRVGGILTERATEILAQQRAKKGGTKGGK